MSSSLIYNMKPDEELQIQLEFKKNMINFFDELIELLPSESDLIYIRIYLKDQVPIIDVINHFILEILPQEDRIVRRDERFFLENTNLFVGLEEYKDNVNHFKKIYRSPCLDDEDKEVIWKWIDTFVFLAKKYQKIKINLK